jgi:hypothetical protein
MKLSPPNRSSARRHSWKNRCSRKARTEAARPGSPSEASAHPPRSGPECICCIAGRCRVPNPPIRKTRKNSVSGAAETVEIGRFEPVTRMPLSVIVSALGPPRSERVLPAGGFASSPLPTIRMNKTTGIHEDGPSFWSLLHRAARHWFFCCGVGLCFFSGSRTKGTTT